MTKVIVKTIESILLLDPTSGQAIHAGKPQLVENSSFVSQKIADKVLQLITPNIPSSATQEELDKHLDGAKNEKLGLASFVAKLGLDETGNEVNASAKAKSDKEAADKFAADQAAAAKAEEEKKLKDAEEAAKLKAAQEAQNKRS